MTEKIIIHDSCSFWAENFGRSLEGQGGPTRGSKVFNTIIQMEADRLRENPTNSETARNTSSNHLTLQKAAAPSLAANNQATRRNEIIKSYLQLGSSSNRYAPRLPQQETKSSTKQLAPTDPILGPEKLLKTGFAQKGLPSCPSGRHKPQSFIETKTLRFCNLDTKNFKKWT